MKYLDQDIHVAVSGFTAPSTATYNYKIQDSANNVIFEGKCFIQASATSYTFYINDIIKSYSSYMKQQDNTRSALLYPFTSRTSDAHLIDTFTVSLEVGTGNWYSGSVEVCLIYRYPNMKQSMQVPVFTSSTSGQVGILMQGYQDNQYNLLPQYPYLSTSEYPFAITSEASTNISTYSIAFGGSLYGTKTISSPKLTNTYVTTLSDLYSGALPHSPLTFSLVDSTNFTTVGDTYEATDIQQHDLVISMFDPATSGYHVIYQHGFDATELNAFVAVEINNNTIEGFTNPVIVALNDGEDLATLSFMLSGISSAWLGKTIYISMKETEPAQEEIVISNVAFNISNDEGDAYIKVNNKAVAQINQCAARYYLMWQDRGGNYQSQPFNDRSTYSEDFDNTYIENYKNQRSLKNINVQPKFKICSDWISQDIYPFYESVFVSPELLLYDTVEDKSYNVIVTGNYTEKTFRNSRNLLNLNLELEASTIQNIIY